MSKVSLTILLSLGEKMTAALEAPARTRIAYRANDIPKWWLAILLGIQQVMSGVSGILVIPFQVSQIVCAGSATAMIRVQLISTTFVVCGITTILQVALGLRLALLQGASFSFLAPLAAFSKLPEFACPYKAEDEVPKEFYLPRLQVLQGSLICASLTIVFLGATGLSGIVTRYLGPLTVAPLLVLLELSVVPSVLGQMQTHWISIIQFAILILFVCYLSEVNVSFPTIHSRKLSWTTFRLFGRFPFLIGLILIWLLCLILTASNAVPTGSTARTDVNDSLFALEKSPWFYIPLPGQFGAFRFDTGLFLGYVAACMVCVVESLGNYQVIAAASQERSPPSSAINRGMLFEGIGCLLSGLMGVGVGVTTFSANIALISITQVASRVTLEIAGVIMILMGIFTKFGAFLGMIPEPLIGALFAFGMAMVAGVALSTLQEVNLRKSRNINILGISIMLGMLVPMYATNNPINTGVKDLDAVLNVVLNIQMLVGGIVAFVLDNTVPGATLEDRGLAGRRMNKQTALADQIFDDGYAFPLIVERILDKIPFARRLPIFSSTRTTTTTIIPQTLTEDGIENNKQMITVINENKIEAAIIRFMSRSVALCFIFAILPAFSPVYRSQVAFKNVA